MQITFLEGLTVVLAVVGVFAIILIAIIEISCHLDGKKWEKEKAEREAKRVKLEFSEKEMLVRMKIAEARVPVDDYTPTYLLIDRLEKDVKYLTQHLARVKKALKQAKAIYTPIEEPINPSL